MTPYEEQVLFELRKWQAEIQKKPSLINKLSKGIQNKLNGFIPDKLHHAITLTIQKMVQVVLFGSKYSTSKPLTGTSLQDRETRVRKKIETYRHTAVTEGAITGAGGILWGLADFPLLIGIKLKLLFEIASLYGINVKDYRERVYILYIFQLAFSGQKRRNEIYARIATWHPVSETLPHNLEEFDWRTFQQEYRDYIDLAKMAQLIPVIGAAVGAIVNYKLINHLGETAMNCYRIRVYTTSSADRIS